MAVIPEITPLPLVAGRYALLLLPDPGAVPPTVDDKACIYIDPADGLLKIKRADGTVNTITVT